MILFYIQSSRWPQTVLSVLNLNIGSFYWLGKTALTKVGMQANKWSNISKDMKLAYLIPINGR